MSDYATPWAPALVAVGATLLGALFAAAETALTSLTPARLGALLDHAAGPKRRPYERIQREEVKLRSRYLLGRMGCMAALSVALVDLLLRPLGRTLPGFAALAACVLGAVLVFEATTTLARRHAVGAAALAVRWLRPLELLLAPLAAPVAFVGALLSARSGEPASDPRVTEAEVEFLVDEVEKSGLVGHEPAEMIRNVLEFADRTARDIMIPRGRIEAIELSTPVAKVVELVTESGHSRYPVYKGQLDNVVGLLYAKDLFKSVERAGPAVELADVIRKPANFVAESRPLSALLREMRSLRQHIAIVVDEFGNLSGIVTLEDVLEEIVGDIRDEHDESEESPIQELPDGRLVADAAVLVRDLSVYLGADLGTEGEADSLGRMLTRQLGRAPEVGTAVRRAGLEFIVRDLADGHVGKIEIVRLAN